MSKNLAAIVSFMFLCISLQSQQRSSNLELRDSLNNLLKNEVIPERRYDLYLELCNTFVYSVQPDSIRKYNDSMFVIARTLRQDSLLGTAYAYKATMYGMLNEIMNSMENYFEGLKYLEKDNCLFRKSFVYKQMGVEFRNISDYQNSIYYLSKARENLPEEGILANRVFTNLSDAFILNGQLDSAIVYAQMAFQMTEPKKDPYGYSRALFLLGFSYLTIGKNELGKEYLNHCIAFSEEQEIFSPLSSSQVILAEYYFNTGNPELAKQFCLKVYQRGDHQIGGNNILSKCYQILQNCYKKEVKKDSFMIFFSKDAVLQSKIHGEALLNAVHNLQVQQVIFEKHQEDMRAERKLTHKKQVQYALIVGLIIVLLLILVFLSNSYLANKLILNAVASVIILTTFELLNIIFHEFIEEITHHNPVWMLLMVTLVAIALVPVRKKFQEIITYYYTRWHHQTSFNYTKRYMHQEDK